jgi:hypothetical protein
VGPRGPSRTAHEAQRGEGNRAPSSAVSGAAAVVPLSGGLVM